MNIELTDIVPGTCLDSDIQKLKCCSICLESKQEKLVSFCTSCIESGNSCHECEIKWVKQEKDPHICTICKSKTKQNIATEALRIYNSRNENNNNRERRETRERNLGSLNGRRATLLRTIDLNSNENGDMDFEIGELENQNYLRDDNHSRPNNNSRNSNNTSNNSEEVTFSDFNNPKKCCCWLSIILIFSWLFAAFSYYVVFGMKKNMINQFHIALACGSIFGIPITIIFRKYLKKNCFTRE